jgi:phage terminase large subunit
VNLRAELYWNVRERFRKTYENVTRGAGYPLEECISIPNDPKLIDQLSWLKEKRSTAGLIQVERKDEMKRRRGSSQSPDHADALVYAFADDVIAPRRTAHIGWT